MPRTNYYVRPVNGTDTALGGTTHVAAWKTTQYALDHITRDAVNGDQINICAEGTDTLGAALVFTTYGTPTEDVPIVFSGYTAAANDGGVGVLSGGGAVGIFNGAVCTGLKDLRLTNTGAAAIASMSATSASRCIAVNCRFDTSSNIRPVQNVMAYGCQFDTFSYATVASGLYNNSQAVNCVFTNIKGIACTVAVINCIFDCSQWTNARAVVIAADFSNVIGNTIYGNANTASAISLGAATTDTRQVVYNNLIVGFSGVGGIGIECAGNTGIRGHNAFYNNSTPYSVAGNAYGDLTAQDITLTADPFVSAATGDFRLTSAAILALRGQRFPETWPGLASMVDLGVIGAWQTAGGGLLINPGLSGGLR
jgi:hypothetical protein